MKTALILYPNQLFDIEFIPRVSTVYLVEEPLIFGTDQEQGIHFHKQKLVLHRASMRRYAEEVLWPNGLEVEYIECTPETTSETAVARAAFAGAEEVYVFEVLDTKLWSRITAAAKTSEVSVNIKKLKNPNFYLDEHDIEKFFGPKSKTKFADFYQWQRERFNVLIDTDYRPYGGKWSFDSENRKKLPADVQLPGIQSYGDNQYVAEAVTYVEANFAANPGNLNNFIWPTNHNEARAWLRQFFETRLSSFGPYEDAIDSRGIWLFHSAISPMLNTGLLNAKEVIESVLDYAAAAKHEVPLESLEGFIRQVMGWREYIRGSYEARGDQMRTKNALGNKRRLTKDWYDGTTGLPPVDDVIKKVTDFAYAHQNERLMIMGNIMLLCDIHPDDVYHWFMTFFIDSYDWVVTPNVYGMSQYADGGTMASKPYMSASNYVLNMSGYSREPWCDIWDGLFWRFVDSHRLMLKKNPRLGGVLIKRYDTMDAPRKRIIGYRAQDFLDNFTRES